MNEIIGENKKILLLSWKVPPEKSGSTTVVWNLAKQFKPEEIVLAGEKPTGQLALMDDPGQIELHYLIKSLPSNLPGKDKWRNFQFPLILYRTIRLIQKLKIDTVVTVFPSSDFLLAGYLASHLTKKRFFPYYHNTYAENRTGLLGLFAQRLQNTIFSKSELVFLLSDGLASFYRPKYPKTTFAILPHSFNDPIPQFSFPTIHKPIRLLILGTIGEACLDATRRVCDAVSSLENCQLEFVSPTPLALLRKMGLLTKNISHSIVPHSTLRRHLSEADIMVLPHGFHGRYSEIEYRTIFPTRTIDYLISGRPILAHCPKDSFISEFIIKTGCALLVNKPETLELIKSIERIRHDKELRIVLVQNALRTAEQFQAARVVKYFKKRIWS